MVTPLLQPVAELDRVGEFGEALEEAVVDRLLHIEARRRDADLAGIAIFERRDRVGGLLRIGVAEHHHRRMAAELHGGALHALGGETGQMLADRHRAGERDLAHHVGRDQMLRHFRRHAEHEIEHARRHAGIDEAAHQLDAAARRLLRRLEDDRAAGRERTRRSCAPA